MHGDNQSKIKEVGSGERRTGGKVEVMSQAAAEEGLLNDGAQ